MADASIRFGVVHTSPTNLKNASTLERGKLYFAAGDSSGEVKQGVYGVVGITENGKLAGYDVAMFGCGSVADGSGFGLSQYNFNSDASAKLKNLHDASSSYLPKTSYVQVNKDSSGYVPKADGAAGTIDSQNDDWVLTFNGSSVDWHKLPANAFKNDNTTYTGTAPINVSGTIISHTNSGVTAGRYGDTSSQRTLEFGGKFKVVDVSVNEFGHVTKAASYELTLPSKPSTAGTADKVTETFDVSFGGANILSFNGSANKTLAFKKGSNINITNDNGTLTIATTGVPTTTEMNTAINTALSSALQYKGTVKDGSVLPTSGNKTGDVYVASGAYTTSQNSISYKCETGDLFIYNGSYFDIVNGENQVSNANADLAWNTSTKIATVDGTEIYVKLPANPNTDTKVSTSSSTSKLFLIGKTDASKTTASTAHYNASVYISDNALYSEGKKVLTADQYTGTVKWVYPGTGLTNGTNDSSITSTGTLNLKIASSSEIGGVKPGTTNGKTYGVQVDASTGEMTVNVPWTDTNTKVTSAANHYDPTTVDGSTLILNASTSTVATWGSTDIITGITMKRDNKGHIVDVSISSVQMPANPNVDTKNTAGSSNKTGTKLLLVGATSTTTGETFTNSNVYINTSNQIIASSGTITNGNTALVNGGTVYTAVEAAKSAAITAATIYWETL